MQVYENVLDTVTQETATSRGWTIEDGQKKSGNGYQMEEERGGDDQRRSWNIGIQEVMANRGRGL